MHWAELDFYGCGVCVVLGEDSSGWGRREVLGFFWGVFGGGLVEKGGVQGDGLVGEYSGAELVG